jgi:hypothetical protein
MVHGSGRQLLSRNAQGSQVALLQLGGNVRDLWYALMCVVIMWCQLGVYSEGSFANSIQINEYSLQITERQATTWGQV